MPPIHKKMSLNKKLNILLKEIRQIEENLNPFFCKKVNPFCKMSPLGFCILLCNYSQKIRQAKACRIFLSNPQAWHIITRQRAFPCAGTGSRALFARVFAFQMGDQMLYEQSVVLRQARKRNAFLVGKAEKIIR